MTAPLRASAIQARVLSAAVEDVLALQGATMRRPADGRRAGPRTHLGTAAAIARINPRRTRSHRRACRTGHAGYQHAISQDFRILTYRGLPVP